jgi:phosphatidylglycerophosphate synthase
MKRYLANTISLSRIILLVPWSLCSMADSPWALFVMALIIATDLIDGPIARRLKTAGAFGGALDAACDTAVAITASVITGIREPVFFAAAAVMGFNALSWVIYRRMAGGETYTKLGRYNGAACYALLAVKSVGPITRELLPRADSIAVTAGLLVVFALLAASTIENVVGSFRRARGSIAAD